MDVSPGSSSESEIEEQTAEACRTSKKIPKPSRPDKPRKKLRVAALLEPTESQLESREVRQDIPIQTLFDKKCFATKIQ